MLRRILIAQFNGFSRAGIQFLTDLADHNNRDWFQPRKAEYEHLLKEPLEALCVALDERFRARKIPLRADPAKSPFRIYRDVRFSKDKRPYKTNIGVHFPHRGGTKDAHAPGFYLHLEPGGSFAGAGLWHPDPAALGKVRDAIVARPHAWKAVLASKLPLEGDALRRPPRGYPPDHPFADDLKRKDFITAVPFTNAQVLSSRFLSVFIKTCRSMSPLLRFLTTALGLPW